MTRITLVACVCSLAAAGSAGAGPESAEGLRASLHAIDMQPLVVRGNGFESNERVRLMLSTAAGQRWRATKAGAAGRFTMGFGVSVGACGRFSLQAIGSRGSRAWLRPLRTQIDCISPDRDDPTK